MHPRSIRTAAFVLSVSLAGACQAGGSFLVFGGAHTPQDRLVSRVEGSQEELKQAREDFGAAFTLYQRLTSPQAVELEDLSDQFSDSIEECEDVASDLS